MSRRRRLRERLQSHRKDPRWIVSGLGLLLLLATGGFYLVQRERDLPSFLVTNRVLLFVLWYINVVLILTVLFVLLRNLFKLAVERRHRILGSKFKLKLVATFIGLSLIPVLLLFAIATELLQGSVERWFNTPLKPVLAQGNTVAQALYDQIERTDLRAAARALSQVQGFATQDSRELARLARRLQELQGELGLDFLGVYEGGDFVQAVVNPQAGIASLPEPGQDFLAEVVRRGQALRREERPAGHGRLLMAGIAAPLPSGAAKTTEPLVVVAGSLLPPALSDASEALIQNFQTFRQLEVQKDDLKASHLLVFLMITLLILLASSWVGLYLARRVTVPIQALAYGTRRIGLGDLGYRVEVEADDELGVLVHSFNQMTEDLLSNKELLEHSNRELKATAERLGEERALLAAVLENVAAGVVSTEAAGRIFTCNGAALALLRQREEEVLGKLVAQAWPDGERGKLAALLAHDPPAGQGSREVHLVLGGEWKTFEAKVTPMRRPDGVLLGRVLVIEDLTELIKAQQLAAWNEAARRIAHEIKNPLTPIRLGAERLQRKAEQGDPGLPQAVHDAVEIIVREVGAIQQMVDEFSRFARMPRPRPVAVDLSRLVDDTLHLYRNLKPGVEIERRLAPLPEVKLDGEQIKRVLINLLDNAVEATDPPGKVTVSAHANDGHLEIQVADTGRGIPPASKEKLFLPYFSTKGRGTGLGLAIVHRIVAEHHGSVRVEDNVPKGSVFTLELPLE